MLALALRYKDRIYYRQLEGNDKVSFGSGKKDTVKLQNMCEEQLHISTYGERISIRSRAPFRYNQTDAPLGTMLPMEDADGTTLYISRATGTSRQVVTLPHNGMVYVGRAQANDICIGLPFVSGKHFQLRIMDGNVRVEDLNSTNGLYLNGLRIKAGMLRPGDELHILTVRIQMVNNTLRFENVGSSLTVNMEAPAEPQANPHENQKYLRHRLSPRIQDQLPQDPIVLDRPPRKGQEYHPSGSRLASMISMGAMAGSTLLMGMTSPALAFARTVSVAANVYNMVSGSKLDKQRREEIEEYNRRREEEYKTYIEAQRARILAVATEQRRILTEENPEPAQCMQMAENKDRRLWERMSTDRDFLDVRLGMGYENLCVPIKNYAENKGLLMEDDQLEELCNAIAEENQIVDFVPARLPMRTIPTVGIIGDRDRAIHLVRNMMVSLTTHHSPNDVQLVGIFDQAERNRWAAMRWLPHIWDDSHQFRYLAFDKKRSAHLCEMLYDELKRRMDSDEDSFHKDRPAPTPHYVIILGSRELVEGQPLLELLTANDPRLGVTAIFLYDDLYYMPRKCSFFVDLTEEYPSAYGKHQANRRFVFSRDEAVSNGQFNAFARRLAAIELKEDCKRTALASSLSFMEGLGVRHVEELNVLQRWKEHQVSDSLTTPIGVMATGKHFYLDIHYKAHGAHGLLAGTTGSGKSELLRTWILSLAVNYHPHEVNFVIIDYKGGGMANKLDALPHVVGKITNIDSNINRTLVSLKREAKRRMKLLEGYPGVDDVDQYMQLYYSGKATEPMPHLIIVSDEFAELKKEEPEFMKELNTLARVGRSVGIHLLLATQRPTGLVDDQIDANSRFRICMKVNSVQDSKDIIKKPDAAAITQRGRAYVRVGEDEIYELFQSYWSGAEYAPEQTVSKQITNQVSIVDVSGERIQISSGKRKVPVGGDQLTAIVNYIVQQAQLARIPELEGPWKPELPMLLPLQALDAPVSFTGSEWKNVPKDYLVPIGMYDRPAMQEQGVQYMNFTAKPHYGIYGGPGSGKTTLLKTMIISMAMQFSPEQVNLYILDFGGRSLGVFEELPHTAMVIRENEEEKLWLFADWIRQETSRRKQLFEREKVANFDQYRRKKADLPAIFVVVDNLLRMSTLYDQIDSLLIELSMTGSDCGVHLVFTSNNINKTSMNLRTNIGGNIALHMTDRNDYRTAVAELPEGSSYPVNPGRALVRDAGAAEFQTAIFLECQDEGENLKALEALVAQMKKGWTGSGPQGVRSMPNELTLEELAQHYQSRTMLPVGLSYQDIQPVFMDLSKQNRLLISGGTAQQAAAALKNQARMLLTRQDNRVYVLNGSEEAWIGNYGHYAQGQMLNEAVSELFTHICQRDEALCDLEDSGQVVDGAAFAAQYPQLCILVNEMHKVMAQLTEQNRDRLVRMCTCPAALGVISIGAAAAMDVGIYMCTEALTIAFVDSPETNDALSGQNLQKGLCVGGKLRNHDSFQQTMLSGDQKNLQLESGDAMVFDCGTVQRIKLAE